MKYLIVNADDFGYSKGINKGIIEAHKNGIVTSTSLMVDEVAADEASDLKNYQNLSVGLHFVALGVEPGNLWSELQRQLAKFQDIVGKTPDHIDTHKIRPNVDSDIRSVIERYVEQRRMPVRSFGQAKFIDSYFARTGRAEVSLEGLKNSLSEVEDGYNELMCHVGYSDDYLRGRSSYNDIREKELETLTSKEARELIEDARITLCNWRDVEF